MTARENTPDDFPPEQFDFLAFCEDCGHCAAVERARIPPGVSVQLLDRRLRCSVCRSKTVALRIVYRGAGGFRHDGDRRPVTAAGQDRPVAQ